MPILPTDLEMRYLWTAATIEIARTQFWPKVVLLDEPAVGLSVTRVAELESLLKCVLSEDFHYDRTRDQTSHRVSDRIIVFEFW